MDFLKWISSLFVAIVVAGCGQHQSEARFFQKTGGEQIVEDSPLPLDQMQQAIFDGNLEKVRMLLDENLVHIDDELRTGRTLLAEAAYRERIRIIRYLREKGASFEGVSLEGRSLLEWCEAHGESKRLLRALLKTREQDQAEMMEAVRAGQFAAVKELLNQGVEVNFVEKGGETPLTFSIKQKAMNALRALFSESELNVNLKNDFQESPLRIARQLKLKAIENELLKRKAVE